MVDEVDPGFIRRALESANLDAVRMALYQQTRDAALEQLPTAAKLDAGARAGLIDAAAAWLEKNAGKRQPEEPPPEELRRLLNMATGEVIGDLEFQARRNLPAFKPFPEAAEWTNGKPTLPANFRVAIVGSGFSGIAMAVQCELLGIPYVVLERRSEPGGTWSINRYPDVRVDTSSITFEFSFEKQYKWSEHFGRGPEVRRYLEYISKKYGVQEKTLFDHDLKRASFDEQRNLWVLDLETPQGAERLEANVLVSATGLFANPKMPAFDGQQSFAGEILHPSRWRDDIDLRGRSVAVIGNGSTGVQLLGAVAKEAKQVYVFQRTPQWISPRDKYGHPMEPEIAWLVDNFPGYWNWWRYMALSTLFDTHDLMLSDKTWQAQGGLVNRRNDELRTTLTKYIEKETGGRQDLIERLTPDYAPFSRRPIVDNGWYRALTRENVELVTDGISQLTPHGIETVDGQLREVDVIIAATGFEVVQYLAPAQFIGRNGVDLHGHWLSGDGPRAYIGMMAPNLPNMFMLYGPNSQPVSGGPSQPVWFTLWAAYAGQCIVRMIENGKARIEVKQEAFDRYNTALDREASGLIQMSKEGGIEKNYYVNRQHGRLQVNAPWYSPNFHRMCTEVEWDDLAISEDRNPQS